MTDETSQYKNLFLKVLPARELNAYVVLRQKRLLLTRAALEELRKGPPTASL